MFQLELEIVMGAEASRRTFTLREGGKILVGRLECDLLLKDRTVSRKHMGFAVRNGKLVAGDLKSTSGTLKNGSPIKQAKAKKGDLFQVGVYQIRVRTFFEARVVEPTLWQAEGLAKLFRPKSLGVTAIVVLIAAASILVLSRKPAVDRSLYSLPPPSYSYGSAPNEASELLTAREAGLE